MTYLFIGGEDHDFAKIGNCSVHTAIVATRRTANARCALQVTTASLYDGFQATMDAASSSFWLTGRVYGNNWLVPSFNADIVAFLDGNTRRLGLKGDVSGHLVLFKRDAAGGTTTLATSTLIVAANTLLKLDIEVSYGVSNTINVYVDSVLFVTYTGDVTTDGATTLSGFVLGSARTGNSTHYWSEVICTTDDTRGLSLVTLPPAADGNAFAWSNSYASLDEVTMDDADLCTSSAANDILETTVTSSGITGTPAIRALAVSARAQKGATGPQNVQMAVRTGAADYFSGTIALPPAFSRVSNIFETNPGTAGAWAHTDLTAAGFNIGAKSIA